MCVQAHSCSLPVSLPFFLINTRNFPWYFLGNTKKGYFTTSTGAHKRTPMFILQRKKNCPQKLTSISLYASMPFVLRLNRKENQWTQNHPHSMPPLPPDQKQSMGWEQLCGWWVGPEGACPPPQEPSCPSAYFIFASWTFYATQTANGITEQAVPYLLFQRVGNAQDNGSWNP